MSLLPFTSSLRPYLDWRWSRYGLIWKKVPLKLLVFLIWWCRYPRWCARVFCPRLLTQASPSLLWGWSFSQIGRPCLSRWSYPYQVGTFHTYLYLPGILLYKQYENVFRNTITNCYYFFVDYELKGVRLNALRRSSPIWKSCLLDNLRYNSKRYVSALPLFAVSIKEQP